MASSSSGRAGRGATSRRDRAAERVHLITATVAMDGVAARRRGRGRVPTGSSWRRPAPGNTDAVAARARRSGRWRPGSRSPSRPAARAGAATAGYAFPGGGATWIRAGALPVGHLCALKARVALALGLGAGLDRDGLAALLADPDPRRGG